MEIKQVDVSKFTLEDRHTDMVTGLVKDPAVLMNQITIGDLALMHAAMGIASEAGEIVDAIKKATIYRKKIDRENVVEELGDMEFFLEDLRQRMSITREETLRHNYNKLMLKRYPNGYSDEAAAARADKQ
jgi:NTP pyrophosphatase (non-canonical NTP hydrolase)